MVHFYPLMTVFTEKPPRTCPLYIRSAGSTKGPTRIRAMLSASKNIYKNYFIASMGVAMCLCFVYYYNI